MPELEEFSNETEQLIANISEQQAIPEDDVLEIFEDKLEVAEDAGLKGGEAEERAQKLLWNAFKRRQQSSATKVEGVILGSGERYDAINYQRNNSIESYQENPQKAVREGEVAIACPPDEAGNLTGNGVVVQGEVNGWAIVTHENNDNILSYNFAERDPTTGEVKGTDDANTNVEDGWRVYPLDTRETFRSGEENDDFGMPQPKHQWTRRGLGLFITEQTDGVVPGRFTFRGKASAKNPPLHEPVQFKANVREDDNSDEIQVYSTNDTEVEKNPELAEKMTKTVDELIEQHFRGTEYYHDLQSLYEYMAEQDGGRRTVIVESDVVSLDLEPNSNNTFRMVIGEMQFVGGKMQEREATVWVPEWHDQYIDFAVDSRVYVIGQANLQDAYNPETGERDGDAGKEVSINAYGLYADPTTKVPREDDIEDLSEDDMNFGGSDDSSSETFGDDEDW